MEEVISHHHNHPEDNSVFESKAFELKFHLGKNIRYHSKRSAFFTCWNNTTKILSYIVGSATIVAILAEQYQLYAVLCNLVVLILNACDSFIGFGDKARDYREFYQGYKKLEMALREAKNESDLIQIWKQADQIELDEPNTLNVLMAICWNEEHLYLDGDPSAILQIKWWQRLPAQFMDISTLNIIPKSASQQ